MLLGHEAKPGRKVAAPDECFQRWGEGLDRENVQRTNAGHCLKTFGRFRLSGQRFDPLHFGIDPNSGLFNQVEKFSTLLED